MTYVNDGLKVNNVQYMNVVGETLVGTSDN